MGFSPEPAIRPTGLAPAARLERIRGLVAISETGAPIASRMRQNIGAALVGNLLEWYDFAVYGFMAAMIGKAFFPATDPLNSLLLSFAVFGVGFLGRPDRQHRDRLAR
jgi:hypothetical protein